MSAPSQAYLSTDIGTHIEIAVGVLASLATLVVIFRLFSRKYTASRIWWDDVFAVLGMIFVWGVAASTFFGVSHGLGKHDQAITKQEYKYLFKQELMIELTYACAIPCIKASILLFLWRIFPSRGVHAAVIALGIIVFSWWLAVVFASVFSCTPVQFQWDKTIVGGHCIDAPKFFLGNAIPNIFTDVAVLLLPLGPIWNLQMPTKKKIYLSGLFALGTFTVATSIVRITYIYGVKTQIWYNLAIGNLWTNLETTLGITCASLPPSVPFFRHVYESRSTWSQSASRLISTPRSRHRDPYSTGRSGRSDGYRDVETGSGSDGTRLVNGSGHAATASADGHVPHPPSIHKDGAQTPRTKEDYALNAIYIKKDTDVYPTDQHSPI